jgi:hypothetical protein
VPKFPFFCAARLFLFGRFIAAVHFLLLRSGLLFSASSRRRFSSASRAFWLFRSESSCRASICFSFLGSFSCSSGSSPWSRASRFSFPFVNPRSAPLSRPEHRYHSKGTSQVSLPAARLPVFYAAGISRLIEDSLAPRF